jgi:hypothetical protein
MKNADNDSLKQLDELLAASNQSWLFGAGVCVNAGIPLMGSLTLRVFAKAKSDGNSTLNILNAVKDELPTNSHIEHILSQLSDYAAIAERSKGNSVTVGSQTLNLDALRELHEKVLTWIAETIRWGYSPENGNEPEQIGSQEKPIVTIDEHEKFVSALFNRSQAGVAERRSAVKIFTINYDTLFEDALALGCFSYWDGFSGGAVAYRSYNFGDQEPESGFRAHVIKLHGSIDWYIGDDDRVWRVRDGDLYPSTSSRVLIYPQATKYLATQRDPFAAQFDLFRRTISVGAENVLAICGYSFGDEHINKEIELALQHSGNKTTILAFSKDLNAELQRWRKSSWGKRLYAITEKGLYVGTEGPFYPPDEDKKRNWWKFEGVTKILNSGAEACVL